MVTGLHCVLTPSVSLSAPLLRSWALGCHFSWDGIQWFSHSHPGAWVAVYSVLTKLLQHVQFMFSTCSFLFLPGAMMAVTGDQIASKK